ncbi:FecR domain-containing protein [Candidatus Saccharibacteria bacterium]|nr:FecR domain-containing protein [Candidatus Saccharibacteria bacterium]MCB9821022.1 FecR domain-containing protein [Candidatus Nomurabacteria bacterium]
MGDDLDKQTKTPEKQSTASPSVSSISQPVSTEEITGVSDQNLPSKQVAQNTSDAPDEATLASASAELSDDLKISVNDGSSRRKKIIIVLAALFLAFGAAAYYWFFIHGNQQVAPEQIDSSIAVPLKAKITLVEGKVDYTTDEGTLWKVADTTVVMEEGDWLRTSSDETSRAVVVFDDGSLLRLNANTEVRLSTTNSHKIDSLLESGDVYARVTASDVRVFSVTTSKLSAIAKGTAFRVTADKTEESIEVYQSTVDEPNTNNELTEGKKLKFVKQTNSDTVSDLNLQALKKDEFLMWNRTQDLDSDSFRELLGFLADIEAPDLNITSPVDGAKIEIPLGSTTASVEIKGTTEPGLNVKVVSDSDDTQEVTADEAGAFSIEMSSREGKVVYTVTVVDKSGNRSKLVATVTFEAEKASSPDPEITLGAVAQDTAGVVLNWQFKTGFSAPDGVKVLWNRNGDLTYPVESVFNNTSRVKNSYTWWGSKRKRQFVPAVAEGCTDPIYGSRYVTDDTTTTICLLDGQSYAFRVCRYDSATSQCDVYSNEIRVSAPGGTD